MGIQMTFSKAATSALQLVVYQEFDSLIEISQNHVVSSEFISANKNIKK